VAKEHENVSPGPAASTPPTPAASKIRLGTPVIYESEKKKEKRRYSKGLKGLQTLERGVSRATERLAESLHGGMSRYRKESRKSSFKKRDGALRDAPRNWTRAAGKGVRIASKAPVDVVKRVSLGQAAKGIRRVLFG